MLSFAMLIWMLVAEAQAAEPRRYIPMPPAAERRERLRLEREQTEELRQTREELRQLRNDGEDRAHRETMEQFRERLRKQED